MIYDAEIHHWEKVIHPVDKWFVIRGVVYNDSKMRFPDGTLITTSKVKEIKDGYALTTYSVYKLIGVGAKVFHNCGHEDKVRPISGWPLTTKGEGCDAVEGYHPEVSYRAVCLDCYKEALDNYPEDIIFSEGERDEYFKSWRNN